MNRETLYASLAGCAAFVLIAYGSFWYFSPAKPSADPVTENGSSPAKAVGAIPADTKGPIPIVVQSAAPDNASPLSAVPSRSTTPTPTAYGSAIGAVPQKAASSLQDDEGGRRTIRARGGPTRTVQDRNAAREERRRRRSLSEDD